MNADNDSLYWELHDRMVEMARTGQADTPEFAAAWSELEQIKNRNGGLPPEGVAR